MNRQELGDLGGRSLEEEVVDSESVNTIDQSSTTTITYDSEIEDLILQVTTAGLDLTKKHKHRGGRRKKSSNEIASKPKVIKFQFKKDPWGDKMVLHDEWPKNMDTLRVIGCNLGGVSYYYDVKQWEQTLGHLYDMQADVYCLSELNLNLYHPEIREKLYEYKHNKDKHSKIHFSCSKPVNKNDKFQMGGTLTGVSGRWSGRDIVPKLQYPVNDYGRWSISHLKGKDRVIVSIITVYRACLQSGQGKNTISIQQQRDIQVETGTLVNARTRFTEDLAKIVLYLQNQSHHVILCGDVNEDLNDKSMKNTWRNMLRTCNMYLATDVKFPHAKLPVTYERGRKCLDMVALSSNLPPTCIKAVGYLSYGDPLPSDHRAIFLDLDATVLFGTHLPDVTKSTFRHFNTKNKKQMNKYVEELKRHYSNNKIPEKVQQLHQDILQKRGDTAQLIHRCKRLEKKTRELMIAAENKLYKGRYGSKHWSCLSSQHAAHQCFILNKQRRHMLNSGEYTIEEMESMEYQIETAKKILKQSQLDARKHRDKDLEQNSHEQAGEWKVTQEQAKKIIVNAEKSKKLFAKLKRSIKANPISSLKNILVPAPSIGVQQQSDKGDETSAQWVNVTSPEQVFEITLRQNASNLMRSCNAVSATGPISQKLGFQADDKEFINSLLSGDIDAKALASHYPELKTELEEFLRSCQNTSQSEMQWEFGKDEYQSLFKKTRESTSCGPSGLHMSHWKVASLDDELSTINAFFMWAAFSLGFVYDRWLISWHCMLLKKKHPYYHKLRIIQLFEGDFNGMLKYLLGRRLMHHMVDTNQIDVTTYGSIPGRDAKEAMKLLDMIYTNHRLMSRTLIAVFNDAAGCYDRIRPNMADFAMQRVGCPSSITNVQTMAQLGMIHRVKTAMGVSKSSIQWKPIPLQVMLIAGIITLVGNIGGIGQGGGRSPVGWLVLLLIMIKAYRQFSPGAQVIDPSGEYTQTIHLVSYVDDNSLLRSFQNGLSIEKMFQIMSNEVTAWWNLLRITGGDLALEKCTYSLMSWKWSGYYNERELVTGDHTSTITVVKSPTSQVSLRKVDPTTAERQLGFRLTMEGSWTDEFEFRLDQITNLSKKIYSAQLSQLEAWMAYTFYVKSTLYYALPLTVFTHDQCNSLTKVILNNVLPKCGLNRHTPRALVFAPKELGGLNFDHIWTKQYILHLEMFQKHLRRLDTLGKSMLCNLNCIQLLLGRSVPFLHLDPTIHSYVDHSGSIGMIWRISYYLDVQLVIPKLKIPHPTQQEGDCVLMDIAVTDSLVNANRRKMEAINACRLYHGVICLSNMRAYNGLKMNLGYLSPRGGRRLTKSAQERWPSIPCPTTWQWGVWKEFVYRHFITGANITQSFDPKQSSSFTCVIPSRQRLHHFLQQEYVDVTQSIQALPSELRFYLGHVHFTQNSAVELLIALQRGTLVGATDGSTNDEAQDGTYSFFLMDAEKEDVCIYGGGKLSPNSSMTSQMTEHYGGIAILLTLLILQSCLPSEQFPSCSIWMDNKHTLERMTTKPTISDSALFYTSADFDLWQLILILQEFLLVPVSTTWVKSHQDRTTPPENLPLSARLNIIADSIATQIYRSTDALLPRQPHEDEGIHVSYKGVQIHDIDSEMQRIIHEQDFQQYVCFKRQWTVQQYDSVLWRSLATAVNKFNNISRINVVQLMHNWQNTGTQKQLHAMAALANVSQQERDASLKYSKKHFLCPICRVTLETNLYFVTCPVLIKEEHTSKM